MNEKAINIGAHIIGWLIFLLLPLVLMPTLAERFTTNSCFLINYTVLSGFTIALFYFNYHFAIPSYYFKQKRFAFIAILIGFIIGALVLFVAYIRVFSMNCMEFNPNASAMKRLLQGTLPRFFMVLIASFIMRLSARIKAIETEKSKAELALLRTQINPHFLFNVLNNIYGQAITKSENTANSIAKLSDLMRYSLNEANISSVSLEKEIAYLNNYLSLQKLRLSDKTVVEFKVMGNPNTWQISPMLFIPFIENAFKYGVSNEIETVITINLNIAENELNFMVKNDILPDKIDRIASNQIGIKNVKNRLALIYGNRYNLDIKHGKKQYQVHLKIIA